MMQSIVLAAFILATTPLCAVPPLGTTLQNAPSDLPGPWIPGKSRIRDYKTLSDQLKNSLKADLESGHMSPLDIAKKYHIAENALSLFGKNHGVPVQSFRSYSKPEQTKKLVQRYGLNKHWLQRRTKQEGAFDLGISKRRFQYISTLYEEQQKKAAQMPSRTHAQKAHQPAEPQAKAAHTGAHMKPDNALPQNLKQAPYDRDSGIPLLPTPRLPARAQPQGPQRVTKRTHGAGTHTQPDNALPKDLERVPLRGFLPLYNPKAHIPLPPDSGRPARAQPQGPQRVTKRTHDAGTHTQPDSALPKDLERVRWKEFLPLYDPKSRIPLPPNLRRPALVESQQRGTKRPHDAGTHMQPKQPKPPKRRCLNP